MKQQLGCFQPLTKRSQLQPIHKLLSTGVCDPLKMLAFWQQQVVFFEWSTVNKFHLIKSFTAIKLNTRIRILHKLFNKYLCNQIQKATSFLTHLYQSKDHELKYLLLKYSRKKKTTFFILLQYVEVMVSPQIMYLVADILVFHEGNQRKSCKTVVGSCSTLKLKECFYTMPIL